MKPFLLWSLLPLLALAEPYCQLSSTDKIVYPLRASNGDDAGEVVVTIDQRSSQIRFDSFATNGYRMYDQHVWFASKTSEEKEVPLNPSGFFMKAQSPTGTTKWVGFWVINPFYCGPQDMALSFHTTMKKDRSSGAVDVYAYDPGTVGVASVFPHETSFQLQCISCEEWEEPDHDEWLANLNPGPPEPLDHEPGSGSGATGSGTGGGGQANDNTDGALEEPWTTHAAEKLHLNCPEKGDEASCQDLMVQGSVAVGHVCLSVNPVTNRLQVTANPINPFALFRVQLWTSTDGIENMPTNSDGAPDTMKFPHYYCDFHGVSNVHFDFKLEDKCTAEEESLSLSVLVHAEVGAPNSPKETHVDAFLAQTIETSPVWYGYMTVGVDCGCDESVRKLMLRRRGH
jgi:hypothetical protein